MFLKEDAVKGVFTIRSRQTMKNFVRKVVNKFVLPHSQVVYAQSGEDLILSHLFYRLGILKPTYIDIGANHPSYISNTYLFYLRGSAGICIEPNPVLCQKLRRGRPRDIVLNAGVGVDAQDSADFYVFPENAHGLSTFSKKDADYWANVGMKNVGRIEYEKVIRVPLVTVNEVVDKYLSSPPDFISLDVEGLDFQILQSLNFAQAPRVFCVETLTYDDGQNETRKPELEDFMTSNGYSVYADTHINTIFFRP